MGYKRTFYQTCKILDELNGHEIGVVCLDFAYNDLFTGSFDNHILCWDFLEINKRLKERAFMRCEDINSKRFEYYFKLLYGKKKKGKKGKKK